MELQLRLPKTNNGDVYGRGVRFCYSEFRKHVAVPAGATKCAMVYDKKVHPEGFGIKSPLQPTSRFRVRPHSTLTRTRNTFLYYGTRTTLAKAYLAGYRGIHFEFEV